MQIVSLGVKIVSLGDSLHEMSKPIFWEIFVCFIQVLCHFQQSFSPIVMMSGCFI